MKILVLNWQDIRNPLGGGAEVHLHEIFRRIAAKGHDVTLFCSQFDGAMADETIDGVKVIREGRRSVFNYLVPLRYQQRFRKEGFDVVVDDINKIPFYTPWYVKEPLVGILHHLFGKSIFSETNVAGALYVLAAEHLATSVYRNTPMVVVSESTRQELLSNGFQEGNLKIVSNCVDHSLYKPMTSARPQTIGYLGRLKNYKSVEDLLYAFEIVHREFPDLRLVILGEGDAREGLERIARELTISVRVDFLGHVSQIEKVSYLNQMKYVVNTSSKEGWGLTVIEANACGVPVIASDVPGLRDSVLDSRTGLLYEYGNIEQLAEKMLLLLRDDNLRSRLAAEALEWSRTFEWDSSADAMLEVLEQTRSAPA
ncbi:MAG: glycosyltransferase family 4 protein [Ignavibacteriales bacterium]|nr:glycosyltransferase family 4 protein [Ignavibacteriales bacterium]